jgi:hypothetical protein
LVRTPTRSRVISPLSRGFTSAKVARLRSGLVSEPEGRHDADHVLDGQRDRIDDVVR